jgi:hypothetical protein
MSNLSTFLLLIAGWNVTLHQQVRTKYIMHISVAGRNMQLNVNHIYTGHIDSGKQAETSSNGVNSLHLCNPKISSWSNELGPWLSEGQNLLWPFRIPLHVLSLSATTAFSIHEQKFKSITWTMFHVLPPIMTHSSVNYLRFESALLKLHLPELSYYKSGSLGPFIRSCILLHTVPAEWYLKDFSLLNMYLIPKFLQLILPWLLLT